MKSFRLAEFAIVVVTLFAVLSGCSAGAGQSEFGPVGSTSSSAGRSAALSFKERSLASKSIRAQGVVETVLYGFQSSEPRNPVASVISDASGALYGTTQDGGYENGFCYYLAGCGGVFKLTPNGSRYTESVLYEFTGGADGAGPFGNLYMDSSGAIYGTTAYAGETSCSGFNFGCGVVFKLTPSGSTYAESTVYTFKGGTDGAAPVAGLIADGRGALYGTTQGGGDAVGSFQGHGTVFKLTPKRKRFTERIIHRFAGCSIPSKRCDGANPSAPLYVNAAGALFGTTTYGGAYQCPAGNLCGTAFELIPKTKGYKERVIYNFKGGSDGANSQGPLVADAQGALYGATGLGGGADVQACNLGSIIRGCGTVFRLTPHKKGYTEAVLHAFQGGSDGAQPQAGVAMDTSGTLYGTTQLGGRGPGYGGWGTVFEMIPSGSQYVESVLLAFTCTYSFCNGSAPRAGLIEINGTLYGTTFYGGANGYGEVFSVTP